MMMQIPFQLPDFSKIGNITDLLSMDQNTIFMIIVVLVIIGIGYKIISEMLK